MTVEIAIADYAAISIGDENIALQNVPVMDMGYVETPLREAKPNLHFLGSLGGDVIGTKRLIVDYIHKQVIFHATEIPANAKTVKMPVQKLPMVELKIRQTEFCFVLDTGANHFVMGQSVAPMDGIGVSSDKDAPHSIPSLTFAGREYKDVTGMITDLSAIRKELHVDGITAYSSPFFKSS